MGRRCEGCACVVKCLFRRGDTACFRAATAWRSIFFGKTLYSLRWQPETNLFVKPNEQRQSREDLSDAMARKGRMKSNECVSATGFVKIRVCILTCCKNRVKPSYFNYDTASNFCRGGLFLRPAAPLKIDAT